MRFAAGFALAFSLFMSAPGFAQEALTVSGSITNDVGRLELAAQQPIGGQLEVLNNVAVLTFDRAVEVDTSTAARALREFVTLARLDPDGMALRLALRRGVSIDQSGSGGQIILSLHNPDSNIVRDVAALEALGGFVNTDTSVGTVESTSQQNITQTPPPPPVEPINVTLSPVFRPEYRAPMEWVAEAQQDLGQLTVRIYGGDVDVEASLSNKFVVLTFPPRSRVDISQIRTSRLSLLNEADFDDGRVELDEDAEDTYEPAERGPIRLTLVGVDGVLSAHRREGSELFVTFRMPPPAEVSRSGNEEPGEPTRLASAENGLEGRVDEADEDPDVVYTGPVTDEDHAAAGPVVSETTVLPVEVLETADGIRLLFAWETETPAAVFRRGNSLWMAFETDAELDIDALSRRFRGLFRNPRMVSARDMAILRIEVPNYVLATTSVDGTSWLITLGEAVAEATTSIEITRAPEHEASPRVLVDLEGASNVHWVRDPDIGDQLAIVTAPGPVRGVITPRVNVEFSLLETSHGLAVESYADDLHVNINDDVIDITRREGLALSQIIEQEIEIEIAEATRDTPGYMDFDTWSGREGETFLQTRYGLLAGVARADEASLNLARLNLVRFYLAQGFNTEAMGVLRYMAQEDPSVLEIPVFRALRGVSYIRMGRYEAGIQDLSTDVLQIDENAALWRGLARHELGDNIGARREFSDGARMLNIYEPSEQARFRIAMAEVAFASRNYARMEDELDNVPHEDVAHYIPIQVELLRGLLAENNEEDADPGMALEHYTRVINSRYEPLVVQGMFHQTRLLREQEMITVDEAIERLEIQRYRWRGDDVELTVLRELGRLYVERGDFREGLRTWRIAVNSFPSSQLAREIGNQMRDTFIALYLDGDVDDMAPIQALGLYYDYRELTPVGRQGDDMIRQLADRLVGVDLLEQAAELLAHQVENRLRGVGRAQVATRLALVYLMDRRPAEALQAIRGTRQTLLPENLNRQRRILEARALAAMDRFDHALEIIENERRQEASRLRAEIQWEAEYWDDSAAGFEELLGSAWRSDQPLNDEQRTDVMRAAIGFIFAEDEIAITRLRTKYARHMAQSPDAEAFEIVTGRIETQGMAFREMARRIAAIDTFDAFMQRMRGEFDLDEEAAIN